MPATELMPVTKLKLDLANYRTMRQNGEQKAIEAIIAIKPDWFWALTESLLDTGYLPTENILVQKSGGSRPSFEVKEGNRRVSALKLIHGIVPLDGLPVPSHIAEAIQNISPKWKRENAKVPCAVYEPEEADTVNRIRSLTHGKGEKAGRDGWTAVARARHNREENGVSEPALDLLEKYLAQGKNHTAQQAQRWAGEYPLTVLAEAIKKCAPRIGLSSGNELAASYPKIKFKTEVENIMRDIGLSVVRFDSLRHGDVLTTYGIPEPATAGGKGKGKADAAGNGTGGTPGDSGTGKGDGKGKGGTADAAAGNGSNAGAGATNGNGKPKERAIPLEDPRNVARALKKFVPRGPNREKVVSLLIEIRKLKLDTNPIAFCFLFRSMFEIAAKAYCKDHAADGLASARSDGNDRSLVDVLRDITAHLTNNKKDKEATRRLHGAMVELARPEGILSVTSMNQLVHNPRFAQQERDIAILFASVFPLLEAMCE